MSISKIIGAMMQEALEGGSDADVSRAVNEVNAQIQEAIDAGAAPAWVEAKRDELKAALCLIEVARWKADKPLVQRVK